MAPAMGNVTYDLNELCAAAGVTPRTVRYYMQQGLLPSPGTRGPGAHYDHGHLDRLRLIRRLQKEHLPLAEIRRRLEALDDRQVAALLRSDPTAPPSTAVDYVRNVLAGKKPGLPAGAPRPPDLLASARAPRPPERSQWERISLSPDVEIHIRRPLSREMNRRVDELLDHARTLFDEET